MTIDLLVYTPETPLSGPLIGNPLAKTSGRVPQPGRNFIHRANLSCL